MYECQVHSRYPRRPEESDFLELELEVVISYLIWMLGPSLQKNKCS